VLAGVWQTSAPGTDELGERAMASRGRLLRLAKQQRGHYWHECFRARAGAERTSAMATRRWAAPAAIGRVLLAHCDRAVREPLNWCRAQLCLSTASITSKVGRCRLWRIGGLSAPPLSAPPSCPRGYLAADFRIAGGCSEVTRASALMLLIWRCVCQRRLCSRVGWLGSAGWVAVLVGA
jgi:hypothetical protein